MNGKFGRALLLGLKFEIQDQHNMTYIDLDLASHLRDVHSWNDPFIWGAGRIQPMSGSVAFWIRGALEPETKLFFQSANAFGRFEKNLLGVSIDRNRHLAGFLVDARYDRHEVVSGDSIEGRKWHHIVFTWDETLGLALFLDGEQVAGSHQEDAWWMTQVPGLFHLPAGKHAYDEFYIFSLPLTADEVQRLYSRNEVPGARAQERREDTTLKARLIAKSGISTDLDLPEMKPRTGNSTLIFEEIWIN